MPKAEKLKDNQDETGTAAPKKPRAPRGLGRGLDALLGVTTADVSTTPSDEDKPASTDDNPQGSGVQRLPVEFLHPNRNQPRKAFTPEAIEELANSIRQRGVLQPILVRKIDTKPDTYEIVAGERRWRAAQKAQLHSVPVIVQDLDDQETAEIALIENLQRVDLNPMEEAEAYQYLRSTYGLKQEQIADAVGKSRSHVANMLRLTGLPSSVRTSLRDGLLTIGHARALLGSADVEAHHQQVLKKGLSVRDTEKLVKTETEAPADGDSTQKPKPASGSGAGRKDADTRMLERDLADTLGLEVVIDPGKKGSGALTLHYQSLDQLDDLCRRLMGAKI